MAARCCREGVSTMNKTELTAELARKLGVPKTKAAEAVNALFGDAWNEGIIPNALRVDAGLTIQGFGSFTTKTRAPRTGVSPATGKPVAIPARTVVRFKTGSGLDANLNSDRS